MRVILDYNPAVKRIAVSSYGLYREGSTDFEMHVDGVSKNRFFLLCKGVKSTFNSLFRAPVLTQDLFGMFIELNNKEKKS